MVFHYVSGKTAKVQIALGKGLLIPQRLCVWILRLESSTWQGLLSFKTQFKVHTLHEGFP
jgi:hypothetical protein